VVYEAFERINKMPDDYNALNVAATHYYDHKQEYTAAEARFLSLYAGFKGGGGFAPEYAARSAYLETAEQYGKAEAERIARRFGIIK
jgi:outer membrane protein assembly factor BamD (BamD/ComL family)